MIYGKSFIYDKKLYPFQILNIKTSMSTTIGKKYEINTFKNLDSLSNVIRDIEYKKPLSFDIEMVTEKPLIDEYCEKLNLTKPENDTEKEALLQKICSNLFAQDSYKKLYCGDFEALQADINSSKTYKNTSYYNCIFNDAKFIMFSGEIYGFKAEMICDAPCKWKDEVHTFSLSNDTNEIKIPISNGFKKYIYPRVIITAGENESTIKISNDISTSIITSVGNNEVITLSNNPFIIESSQVTNKFASFNKKWVKLDYSQTSGMDTFTITGDVVSIRFEYRRGVWINGA